MKALQASQYIGLLPGSPSELQILQWSPWWLKLYQYNRTTRTTHHTPPWPQVLDCNSNLLSGFSLCSAGTRRREPWKRGCTNGKSLKSGVGVWGGQRQAWTFMGDVMRPSSHIKKSSGFIIELSGAISGLKSIRLTRDFDFSYKYN